MISRLASFFVKDYKKINRYAITSVSSYLFSIIIIYLLNKFISEINSIIYAQIIKTILIFILVKYYTFQNYEFAKKQFLLYFLFVILFKLCESLFIFVLLRINISIELNILIVLIISSIIKYFVFKFIFR